MAEKIDKAVQTMMDNLKKISGKSLDEWITVVNKQKFSKHGEYLKYLKGEHGLTHGYANLISMKARAADSGSVEDKESLVTAQYNGKESLKPIYDKLHKVITKLGKDVEVSPKKAYVSMRRKKQFAMLIPATKTRFDLGLNLKGTKGDGVLEEITKANTMCSHKIKLNTVKDVTKEVTDWVKKAYEAAG